MTREFINRRDFLKLSAVGAIPKWVFNITPESEPLTNLPIFHTHNAPMHIEHLSRGGHRMDMSQPGYEMYAPDMISVSGLPLDIKPPLYIDEDLSRGSELAWVADLPHVTGLHPIIPRVVLGWGDRERIHQLNGYFEWKSKGVTISNYAFSDKLRIYPSKIYNILTALSCIAEWQDLHGPMRPGSPDPYSYLVMSGAPSRNKDRYIKGGSLEAGGICASVATLSKCIFIAEAREITEITNRKLHKPQIQYAENPGDPAITKANSDATVGWGVGTADDNPYSADLRWKILTGSKPLYLSFSAHIKMDEEPIDAVIPRRHYVQPADARLTFAINLQTDKPDHKMEIGNLLSMRDRYVRFHNFDDGLEGGFSGI